MSSFARADRVSSLIQRNLSDILRKEIKDPRLEMTVITGVQMSQDLKNARIYFSVPGSIKERKDAFAGFKSAHGYIKRTLAQQLGLRYMPEIKFFYDESFDYATRINELLKDVMVNDE